jgi:hypothetical protein
LHDPKRATYITETRKIGIKRKRKNQNNNLIKYKNFNIPIEVAGEKHVTEQRNREKHTNLLKKRKT